MSGLTISFAVPIIFLVAACENSGANYTPIIDGPTNPNYNVDLSECQSLAASGAGIDERTAGAVATGAVVAGASSAIWNGKNIGKAAGIGALAGLTTSEVRKNSERETIVKRCMVGRGYNVIG